MTPTEKRKSNAYRQKAVRDAWKNERLLVHQGQGTRDWSVQQQEQILQKGQVSGFFGHHMKSVHKYEAYSDAGDCNIQFLTKDEHIAAHRQGITEEKGFRCQTNGYYNHETGQTEQFMRAPHAPKVKELSERYQAQQAPTQTVTKKKTIEQSKGVY